MDVKQTNVQQLCNAIISIWTNISAVQPSISKVCLIVCIMQVLREPLFYFIKLISSISIKHEIFMIKLLLPMLLLKTACLKLGSNQRPLPWFWHILILSHCCRLTSTSSVWPDRKKRKERLTTQNYQTEISSLWFKLYKDVIHRHMLVWLLRIAWKTVMLAIIQHVKK